MEGVFKLTMTGKILMIRNIPRRNDNLLRFLHSTVIGNIHGVWKGATSFFTQFK